MTSHVSSEGEGLCNGVPSRDSAGRFMPQYLNSGLKKRAKQKRDHLKRRSLLKEKIFEEYIHAICCKGNEMDFLKASRSEEPVVLIFEALIESTYRLGRNGRSKRVNDHFVDTMVCSENISSQFNQAFPQSESLQKSSSKAILRPASTKLKKYKGWRLPLISRRTTELVRVEQWLEFAFRENAIQLKTVAEAFSLCVSMISDHQAKLAREMSQISGCFGCIARNNVSLLCNLCSASFNQEGSCGISSLQGNDEAESFLPLSNAPSNHAYHSKRQVSQDAILVPHLPGDHVRDSGACEAPWEENQTSDTPESHLSSVEKRTRENMLSLIDTAKNDVVYMLLASLFDKNRSAIFGLFAGDFLKKLENSDKVPTTLLQEVLTHAKCQRWGIPDQDKHASREKSLRATLRLMQAFRKAAGLKSFEELRWSFVDQTVVLSTPETKRFSL